jgi:hypothetical protein
MDIGSIQGNLRLLKKKDGEGTETRRDLGKDAEINKDKPIS